MRFPALIPSAVLGILTVAAVGCSGSSPSQPLAGLSGAGVPAGASAATRLAASQHARGVRRSIAGCSGSGIGAFIGGKNSNVAAGQYSGVLSGAGNQACDVASGIAVGENNIINTSGSALDGFIGGGFQNAIGGPTADDAFIGAGFENSISADEVVIGGGQFNTAGSSATFGVIGGGDKNTVSAQYASILGGITNTASGTESTVAGGGSNVASGYASLAAGYHADANQAGSFVWSDSSSSNTTKPTAAYQFVARASGGVKFFSNAAMTTGVSLAAGGGSWASVSDRAVKTDVASIDDAQVLDRVASLPITEWSYISERGVRHVGPMAQDFYAAFGVGEDNKHITSIDEDGVALAAIKGLHEQNRVALAAIKVLHRENRDLQAQLVYEKAQQARKDAAMLRRIDRLSAEIGAVDSR